MQHYELYLKNDRTRFYNRFAFLLLLLNAVAMFLVMAQQTTPAAPGRLILFAGVILFIATFIVQYLIVLNKKDNDTRKAVLMSAGGILLFWVVARYWWIGAIVSALFFLYWISKRRLRVDVQAAHIAYPAFPVRILNWKELSNVILKDGLLTIDLRNNKIIQQMLSENSTINEREFNEFCRQQLLAAR